MYIEPKKLVLLIITAAMLLSSMAIGCEQHTPVIPPVPSTGEETTTSADIPFSPFDTYALWGFTISVPPSWLFIETRNLETGGGVIDLFASSSTFNSLSITASAIEKIGGAPDIATEAQRQIEKAEELWGNIELQNNQAKKDNWDWFLSFNSILESTNEDFHTEIYFKATQTHYYIVKLSFAEADRNAYPWKEVIETFTLS